MQQNRYGAFAPILIAATLVMFVALLGHPAPSGHAADATALLAALYRERSHLQVMHGAVLLDQLVILACILALCARAGMARPLAAIGAVFFSAGTAAVCVAGSIDGFLIPAFAAPHVALFRGSSLDMQASIAAGAFAIQYATKSGIALFAVAVLLLSLALAGVRGLRAAAAGGIAASVLQLAVLFAIATITPRNVAFAGLPVLVWQAWIGFAWLQAQDDGPERFAAQTSG